MPAGRGIATLFLMLLLSQAGCVAWHQADLEEAARLPAGNLAPGSVVIETVVLRVPWADEQVNHDIWRDIDEQRIDVALRRRLHANGFRCGVIGPQMPEALTNRLQRNTQGEPRPVDIWEDHVSTPKRFQRRRGQPFEIATPQTYDRLPILFRDEEDAIHGYSFENAQCRLVGKPYPRGDSDVDLIILPAVHHGAPRQQFLPADGYLRMEVAQEARRFQTLEMPLRLAPGEMLMITSTPDAKGLGDAFFSDRTTGRRQQRLVLIRIAQTQQDDLFESQLQGAQPTP